MDSHNAIPQPNLAPPLWQQLQACAKALQAVLQGRNHGQALSLVDPHWRPAAQAQLFEVLRHWGRVLALKKLLVQRQPSSAANAMLCVGLGLLLPNEHPMYPPHTLVSQLVEAAKRDPATKAQAAFVNACLRRFLREQAAMMTQTNSLQSAQWNVPQWWIDRVRMDHPDQWQVILQASQQPAPLAVRVQQRLISRRELQAVWASEGLMADLAGEHGLILRQARPVHAIPGFDQGWWSVQDLGAQQAAPVLLKGLKPQPGSPLHILDACAAPGGKTAHLLEISHALVTALDIDPLRCQRIEENLHRLKLQARVMVADAARPTPWWDGRAFDGILLDAPCTASGIVRRHPDIPWLRRATDVAGLAAQQKELLHALWPLLAPGGRLLYCTCSVFAAEGRDQIQAFLANNTQARWIPTVGPFLPGVAGEGDAVTDNRARDHDGFFYALLERRTDA